MNLDDDDDMYHQIVIVSVERSATIASLHAGMDDRWALPVVPIVFSPYYVILSGVGRDT